MLAIASTTSWPSPQPSPFAPAKAPGPTHRPAMVGLSTGGRIRAVDSEATGVRSRPLAAGVLIVSGALGLVGPLLPARAGSSCDASGAPFSYDTTTAATTFTLRPSCAGTRRTIGDTTAHLDARRCDSAGCVVVIRRTVRCTWSADGCTYTLRVRHKSVERAGYQFDLDYANDRTKPRVFAGADSTSAQCTSAAVTTVCSPA